MGPMGGLRSLTEGPFRRRPLAAEEVPRLIKCRTGPGLRKPPISQWSGGHVGAGSAQAAIGPARPRKRKSRAMEDVDAV